MHETYRMLGEQHEAELLRAAQRANARASRPNGGAVRDRARMLLALALGRYARRPSREPEFAPPAEPGGPTT